MFDELNKYKNHGHFFLSPGENLREKSAGVPDLPGVYYIFKLARGKIELVYIGSSGTMQQEGNFKKQFLYGRLNNKQDGLKRQQFFNQKMKEEDIDALDIYWFVTFDENHQDLPGYVEGLLMQRFYTTYGELPAWNKQFPA